MNSIYILSPDNFSMLGVIDEYVSTIWRPSYSEVGDFEIFLGASVSAVNLLQKNRYVVRSCDVNVIDGVVTYKKVMIIKNIELSTDVEDGDFLKVTGRELKFLMHQRIVWGQYTLAGDTVEYGIRRLLGSNAVNPVEPTRTIPNMQFTEAKGLTDTLEKQVSNKALDEAVVEICQTYKYGWDIYIADNKLTIEIYQGVDRSYGQTERPYVVFSDTFDNLHNTTYELASEEYFNMALVGGEGEEDERIYNYVNNELSGLERYETFVDAKDISQNSGSDNAIDTEEYLLLLEERGKEKLSTMTLTEGFTGEVLSDTTYAYGVDFFLGDIVTVINKYGISKNVRVLSVIESENEDGIILMPQFNF